MLCGEAFISQITANQIGQDKAAVITQMRRIVNGGTTGMYGYLSGLERFKNGLLPFYDIKHGGKGIAATFGCFLGLLPHWIPLCVLAGIFIFFSCVVKINPNYYRTVATYILAAICTVWLEPNRYIVFGFLLIAASVLAKLFISAEEKEHFEVKLAWKH